jgi:hypothetical protein
VKGNNRTARIRRLALTAMICCLMCAGGAAQQSQSTGLPDTPSASTQSQTAQQQSNPALSEAGFFEVLQKKSRVFPDLATERGPLDSWDKFKLAVNDSVSLSTIGAVAIGAGFGQAIDSPSGYGQGGEGYGKRLGANMARAASANIFGTFLIASVTHEDPRFYVKKHLSFKESIKYAAERLVITRSDSGERVVSYADLLGPLAGEALANTYYPEGNRGVGDTFIRYASDMGWKFGGNLLRQYWPTISRRMRKSPPATSTRSSN